MSLDQLMSLRRRFSRFVYESFAIREEPDSVRCVFQYRMEGDCAIVALEHQVRFAFPARYPDMVRAPVFARAVFLLGLAEAISYWKMACPETLLVQAGALAPEEAAFWERLYTRGLGEFWYLNGIYGKLEETSLIRIVAEDTRPVPVVCHHAMAGQLVPVGGGKDSVVTLELLKQLGHSPDQSDCFLLSARQAAYDTAAIAGCGPDRQVEVFRVFDPQLFAMNREGYLNGHVPYSAILGFTAVAAALLRGRREIVLSNEGSANEPTVPGTWVNHQYSKSLDYEIAFQDYLRHHLTPEVVYFSLLRPWSEARIAMAFAGYDKYHAAYRSCNRGAKDNRWCCDCPKCLFVFLLVAAHAGVARTTAMFGENLLEKASLVPTLDELAGFAPVKPFECVGTVEETCWSLEQILTREDLPEGAHAWPLLAHYRAHAPAGAGEAFELVTPALGSRIPHPFRALVLPAPTPVMEKVRRLLAGKSLGVLGYGMEGRSTLRFLRELFPDARIPVADSRPEQLAELPEGVPAFSGPDYAGALAPCDAVFKAPGIPWKTVDSIFRPDQITSQTDLFLRVLSDRTIGVTGTKGKSTTTALIRDALRACGHDAVMIGNMGIPALDALRTDHPGRVYVCELSSHMLETIRHAPRGAVYLNLFADHLDHYRSFDAYAAAKDQLLRHQGPEGFAVVGPGVADRTRALGAARKESVCLDERGALVLPEPRTVLAPDAFSDRLLPGRHNLSNLQTACLTVHLWETLVAEHPEGVSPPAVQAAVLHALNRFPGLPHRMRLIGVAGGIRFWDDSISTIPEASMLAVEAIGDVDTLVFGGLDRGISYNALTAFLAAGHVRNLIGLPDTGHQILEAIAAINGEGNGPALLFAADMAQAVAMAFEVTSPGKSCLLSPAAASYGWYRNFEERGDHFSRLVLSRDTGSLSPQGFR